MPQDNKIHTLWKALDADGHDVGTEQEFTDWFQAKGEEGYKNRHQVWQAFKDAGADVGNNYEEFRDWLGLQPRKQAQPKPQQPQFTPQAEAAESTRVAKPVVQPQRRNTNVIRQKQNPLPQGFGELSPNLIPSAIMSEEEQEARRTEDYGNNIEQIASPPRSYNEKKPVRRGCRHAKTDL